MSKSSVLVVEDDVDVREALVVFLQGEGYDVVEAEHGQEALQRLRSGPRIGLILLDLMMPVMNGWQFREAQTKDPSLAEIPVVIVTADHGAVKKAAAAGAAGCLLKPVELGDVLDYVGRYCGTQ
jgi:CheY-like chemotaxis protein